MWLHKPPGPRAVYDLQESERVMEGERERQEDEENRLADWKLQLRCWDNGAKHLISIEHSNQGSPSLLSDSSSHFHLCRHTYMHQFYSMEQWRVWEDPLFCVIKFCILCLDLEKYVCFFVQRDELGYRAGEHIHVENYFLHIYQVKNVKMHYLILDNKTNFCNLKLKGILHSKIKILTLFINNIMSF